MRQEGELAPEFKVKRETGEEVTLKNYRGKYVVLYFYPKDNTPGCTVQGKSFSQYYHLFQKHNIEVLGVSKDSEESHCRFKDKHEISIPLLSDKTGEMCEAYGVWQEKKVFGKIGLGIVRATFIINPEGKIEKVYPKAGTKTNAQEVLGYFNIEE